MPSANSLAALAAICSRLHAIGTPISRRRSVGTGCSGWLLRPAIGGIVRPCAHLLDAFVLSLFGSQGDDALHEYAGGVHLVRVDLARLDELLDLGDGDAATHRRQRVEVSRCATVHQVAV